MRRVGIGTLAAVALVALASADGACAPEEIVVATLPVDDAGPPPHESRRCATNADCKAGDICSKPSCSAVAGECERRPMVCQPDATPVCGCDGVTYFNDCLRRAASVVSSVPGECSVNALTCTDLSPCPAGAYCARLLASRAECPGMEGICWVLPAECPAFVAGDRWSSCAPPAAGGPSACTDTCRAIQEGHASTRTVHCPDED